MDAPLINTVCCPEYDTPSWSTWLKIQIENFSLTSNNLCTNPIQSIEQKCSNDLNSDSQKANQKINNIVNFGKDNNSFNNKDYNKLDINCKSNNHISAINRFVTANTNLTQQLIGARTPNKVNKDNRACTNNMALQPAEYVGKYGGKPWKKRDFKYSIGIIG